MVFREEVLPLADDLVAGVDFSGALNGERGTSEGHEIMVTIPPGAFLEEISILLESKGVVPAAAFEAEAHRRGVEHKIKAGSYYLPRDDINEIINRLTG